MLASVDGKISGKYMNTAEVKESGRLFYNLAFGKDSYYGHQGWLSGRSTTDDNFTNHQKPDIDEHAADVPEGDFIVESDLKKYYVSVDPSGKLGWKNNTINYKDTKAHVLEILTENASNGYKAMLRKLNIPYLVAGKDKLDYSMAMQKLKEKFHIDILMLGGGGVLNWSFIQAGLCDELSIVISPTADGAATTPSLFETKNGLSEDNPVSFTLQNVEAKEDGSVWLRYLVNNP